LKKKLALGILLIFLFSIMLTGCSSSSQAPSGGEGGEQKSSGEKVYLSMGTGGTSGSAYVLGSVVCDTLTRFAPNVEATVQATGGSVENHRLIGSKTVELGHTTELYKAYNGKGAFEGEPDTDSVVVMMYASWHTHIVTLADSGINSVYDLKGKRVGVGPPGSGTEINMRAILAGYDMTFDDIKPEFLSFAEQVSALKDGTIEAGAMMLVPPGAGAMDLASTHDMKLISIEDENMKKILEQNPDFDAGILPGGTYRGVDVDTATIVNFGHIITHKDMPEDLIYNVVKALWENKSYMDEGASSFKFITIEDAATKTLGVPLHPGAEKYFKEVGAL
jgi:TRAP transporter TAXI family solute receptor